MTLIDPVAMWRFAARFARFTARRMFCLALWQTLCVALCLCAANGALAASARSVSSAASAAAGADASKSLEREIAEEQARAKARRASLTRLTEQERALNADLAVAEDRILRLEADMGRHENKLADLAASDAELQGRIEALKEEQGRTEKAMLEVLRALWELHARRVGVGGRDMPDWPVTDREQAWSAKMFAALDGYRADLARQGNELEAAVRRRDAVEKDAKARLALLNTEKERLLQSRLSYNRMLGDLRKQKRDTEEELVAVLDLVKNLNLRLEQSQERGDLEKAKGKLPWPAGGTIRTRFDPGAAPPSRGVTIARGGAVPVTAVHWGKVVHNDVLRGIGRVVILMHGSEYYSLYAFLSESSLRVGQEVARGETVGSAGFVPVLNGPGLYFELRFHQKAINPEQWLRSR